MKTKSIKQLLAISLCIAAAVSASSLSAKPIGMRGPDGNRPGQCVWDGDRGMQGGKQGRMGPRDPGMHLLQRSAWLELTDAQEASILELSQQFRNDMETHRKAVANGLDTLREIREAETFDENALREAMDALHPLRVDGMIARESYRHALHELLTESQRAKLEAAVAERGRRGEWGPRGGRRGPDAPAWGPQGGRGNPQGGRWG